MNRKLDDDKDPIMTWCNDSRDELCLRVITEARHLLRDNPALSALEEMGQKDHYYVRILDFIRTKHNFKELPTNSEGFRMGGE